MEHVLYIQRQHHNNEKRVLILLIQSMHKDPQRQSSQAIINTRDYLSI